METLINFTPVAAKELASCFGAKDKNYIRIFVHPISCAGPVIRMMREASGIKPTDAVFDYEKFTILVDKELLEKMEFINLDFNGNHFDIQTNLKGVSSACMSCPYGNNSWCNMMRREPKNYATWKVKKPAAA